jgi:hypothetical protein
LIDTAVSSLDQELDGERHDPLGSPGKGPAGGLDRVRAMHEVKPLDGNFSHNEEALETPHQGR